MAGGTTSRGGFYFQDLVLAERLLAHLVRTRKAEVDGLTAPAPPEFRIEAPGVDGDGPDWDLVQQGEDALVLEEVKSGSLRAEDRRTLWRRVRQTLASSRVGVEKVRLQLTVNGARPPDGTERWHELARVGQTAPTAWPTHVADEPYPRVNTAEALASEALHLLSHASADASRALSEQEARQLLAHFAFDDTRDPDGVEQAACMQVRQLTGEVGALDVLRTLQGHIAQRAASSDPAAHRFTANDLAQSIELVAKLATVDHAAVATWRHLGERSCALEAGSEPAGGLAYQSWRRVQPRIAERLDQFTGCVAVLGRGGQGKSVLLRHWIQEERAQNAVGIWITATDLAAIPPERLTAALDLGFFSARSDHKRLVVVVDALEVVGTLSGQQGAAAALALAARPGVAIAVSCRAVDWRVLWGSQESIAGWDALDMSEWSEEIVRKQVAASQRPSITADLLRLLRTPLLLDVFLRTFAVGEPIPDGLPSRFGLLRAYWDRRVLPDGDPRAAHRRALLVRVAEEEAHGFHAHDAQGRAADDLTSEGLFSLVGGQRIFRHVLFRDFTMMIWALHGLGAEAGTKLGSIGARITQFGALRATLEAAFGPNGSSGSASASSVISALSPELLSDAATVLGELEDTRSIELSTLLDAISDASKESFLQSLLRAAKVAGNPEALRQVARLESTEAWAKGSAAVGVAALLELAALAQALLPPKSQQPLEPFVRRAVAERLRVWSLAAKLREGLCADGAGRYGALIRALVALDPSRETLEWLARVTPLGSAAKYWTLSELPVLVRSAEGTALADSLLADLYVMAANLRWEGRCLRDAPGFKRNNMTDYDRIDLALVGQHGDAARGQPALLHSRPQAFVPIAMALLAGHEADERDERQKRSVDLAAKLASLGQPLVQAFQRDEPAGIAALEQSAEAIIDATEFNVDLGDLVVDAPRDRYVSGVDQHYDGLILTLRRLAERSLQSDGQFIDEFFWPAVMQSSSVVARTCALDLLTQAAATPRPAYLDALLADGRMYLVKSAQVYLQRAIAQRWPASNLDARHVILRNVVGAGRSARLGILGPGPLLATIPIAERPAELGVFVRLYEERGWRLGLVEHSPMRALGGAREPLSAPSVDIPGVSANCQDDWNALIDWNGQRPPHADAQAWAGALAVVTRLSHECLQPSSFFVGHHHLVGALGRFMRVHASRKHNVAMSPLLEEQVVRTIATWAIDAAGALPPEQWTARIKPHSESGGLPDEGEVWIGLLALADACLSDERLQGDADLHERLFACIAEVPQQVPAPLACLLLDVVHGWMRGPAAGRNVLLSLLRDRVRSGRALSIAERYLQELPPADQEELLRRWLTRTLRPPIDTPGELARSLGQHVGCLALCRYPGGEKPGSAALAWEVLANPPSDGLLADAELFEIFAGQLSFGCKLALASGCVPMERAGEYGSLTKACWQALAPRLAQEGREGHAPAFALWVFCPLFDDQAEDANKKWTDMELDTWWALLEPLARSIVREGPSREVSSLTRLLSNSRLSSAVDAARLWPLFEAIALRTEALDSLQESTYWRESIAHVSILGEKIAGRTSDRKLRERLYEFVSAWGAPPLCSDEAAAAAKRIREQRGD